MRLFFLILSLSFAYAEPVRHSFSQNIQLKNTQSNRKIIVPAKQGYTLEVLSVGETQSVVRVYDRAGAVLQGDYFISNDLINEAIQDKIQEGLKAAAEGAKAAKKGCCDFSDPEKDDKNTQLVVSQQEKKPSEVKKAPQRIEERKTPAPIISSRRDEEPVVRKELTPIRSGTCGVYQKLLQEGVPREPLAQALLFYEKNKGKSLPGARYMGIADLSQKSSRKRFYLIDIQEGKIARQEKVSHGGGLKSKGYPGDPGRYSDGMIDRCGESDNGPDGLTRAGFFKVLDFYLSDRGRYRGWPLVVGRPPKNAIKLTGLSPNVNSNAWDDGVVMHEANYNSPSVGTNMGRSHGCPAFAPGRGGPVMRKLQGGSLLYNYVPRCSSDMNKVYRQVSGWENFCR